ncbi:hypothetical protein LCGC14_1255830 [marine sediment metagenome]|uniref:DNA methylase N-4/N-6 domain-containing protein n=1 Tax=marine sediment metagenome TaxID=412755 RepID=A0A0F9P5J7_9ZZZZ
MGSKLAHQHPAPFPEKLAEFFIRSFCIPGGTIIDPFLGSGTTGVVATQLGRRFIGIELNENYVQLARRRINKALQPLTFRDMDDPDADIEATLFTGEWLTKPTPTPQGDPGESE